MCLFFVGPRFVLNPVKIFEGSFGGSTLYENPKYISPNIYRSLLKRKGGMKYKNKLESKRAYKERVKDWVLPEDPYEQLFASDPR
jgi:ribosome biogenesis protein BRX1